MKNNFNKYMKELKSCRICYENFGFEPKPIVFGNQKAKIMQISQSPSKNVHKTGKPFNDLSGKKLKFEWYQITEEEFYNPNNFYITSLSHCYPGKDQNGNDKQPPKICYKTWLKKEIQCVDNKLYIIIGSKAAKVFFPKENFNDLVFKNNYLNNKLAIVLPHPSPLNFRWLKNNPNFLKTRIPEIRKIIKVILSSEK